MTFDVDDLEIKLSGNAPRSHSEYHIHVGIIDHLRGRIRKGNQELKSTPPFPGLFVTHLYTGRSNEDGFFLKALGVVSGIPDLLLIWPDKARGYDFGFLEVKSAIGTLSTPQRRFRGFCHHLGIKWGMARSVSEAHAQIKGWGVVATHNSVKEPDTRTWQQKTDDAMALFRPPPKA